MTVQSYPPPCRNILQPFYLSVTLYACAQRGEVYNHRYRPLSTMFVACAFALLMASAFVGKEHYLS